MIIYNDNKLNEEDINRIVRRGKIIIYNSTDEILIAECDNIYFLIGGRIEEGESFEEGIKREVLEETGIELNFEELSLILNITYMIKDYPNIGVNSKVINHYYCIKCDQKLNFNKMNLTDEEKMNNFKVHYIHKDNLLNLLEENYNIYKRGATKDTIEAIKEFLKL